MRENYEIKVINFVVHLNSFNNIIYLFLIILFDFIFSGLTRPSMYPFPTGQYPYPILSPESMQVGSW